MRGFKLDIVLVLTLGLAVGEWLAFRLLSRASRLLTPLLAQSPFRRDWDRTGMESRTDWPGLSADAY